MSSNNFPASLKIISAEYIKLPSVTDKLPAYRTFADFIRRIRTEKKMSQRDVALKSRGGISDAYIAKIETYAVLPDAITPKKMQALAFGLGITEGELYAAAKGVDYTPNAEDIANEIAALFSDADYLTKEGRRRIESTLLTVGKAMLEEERRQTNKG